MADAVDALRQVVQRGTAQGARAIGRPAAGKTGTTDENRAAWFVGFTPDIATAVGMYLPDAQGNAVPMQGAGLGSGVTGGSYPVDVWTAYMRRAVEGTPYTDFPPRAGIGRSDGDREEPEPPAEPTQPEQTEEWPAEESPSPIEPTEPVETWSPTDVPPPPPTEVPLDDAGQGGNENGGDDPGADTPEGDQTRRGDGDDADDASSPVAAPAGT